MRHVVKLKTSAFLVGISCDVLKKGLTDVSNPGDKIANFFSPYEPCASFFQLSTMYYALNASLFFMPIGLLMPRVYMR